MKGDISVKRCIVCVLFAVLIFLPACSSIENPARSPFSSSECNGMDYDEVLSALKDAGFSNIQTSEDFTKSESQVGTVKSVSIGGESTFSTSNVWEDTVSVDIVRYELEQLEVFADVEVSGEDGKPVFTVSTNIPDGSVLILTLSDGNDYTEQQDVKVKSGTAASEPFTRDGSPLAGGYDLTVVMEPGDQGFFVRTSIGADGQYLSGPLIEEDSTDGSHYVFTETHYDSPFSPPSTEEIKAAGRELDAFLISIVSAAEQDYSDFSLVLSSQASTQLDIYNAAMALKGKVEHYILDCIDTLDVGILTDTDEMIDAASTYIYSMSFVADEVLAYLDDPKTSALASVQGAIEQISVYAVSYVSARFSFLSACGFTEEEISALAS